MTEIYTPKHNLESGASKAMRNEVTLGSQGLEARDQLSQELAYFIFNT